MLNEKRAHFRLTCVAQDETLLLKLPNVIGQNHLKIILLEVMSPATK